MYFKFSLPSPLSHDRVRALFEAMARVLTGLTITLVRQEHHETWDPNHAAGCFDARWAAGGIVFVQRVEAAEGNPRDGFPYVHSAELTLHNRTLRASDSGGCALFAMFAVEVSPCSDHEALALRGFLRAELGAERDLCSTPWVPPRAIDVRVDELEAQLKRLRHAFAGLNDYDLWERWGASSAPAEYAQQMHAQSAACRKEESEAKSVLDALIVKSRFDAPASLSAWVAKHDAYQAEQLAACLASDDQYGAERVKRVREKWAELRAGRCTFFDDAAAFPSDRDRYRRIFGRNP